jgi:prepilin-type N-terminal cleavage/methylation domain-containing protein
MKRGFTLLELIVVVIILGVLATLGIQQYMRMIEKSRGAEAKTILGQIRTAAVGYRLQNANSCASFDNNAAGIGTSTDQIPSDEKNTNYFSYTITSATAAGFVATATRNGSSGKAPPGVATNTLILTTDFTAGTDVWSGSGGY